MGKSTRMAKIFRRVVVGTLAGCMLYGGCTQVSAATLKDVFDEHYYADTNEDLKEAYGYDREQLWEHFITFGIKEGRNMNQLIDLAKYRALYPDLDAAFGDDWEAYLNHYLTYGAKEGRYTGTAFNVMDYADRYEDLKEIFGDDVLALWDHYQTYGKAENREIRSETIVAAEKEAERRAAQEAAKKSLARTEREDYESGMWSIIEYDERGLRVKSTNYTKDGTMSDYAVLEYDVQGQLTKTTLYRPDGTVLRVVTFGKGKRWEKETYYNTDGSVKEMYAHLYDSDGNRAGSVGTTYEPDGSYQVIEYDVSGHQVGEIKYYDAEGNPLEK